MNVSGITSPVGMTSLGAFSRSIPRSNIGAVVQHPGGGPDLTVWFFDTASGKLLTSVTVGETNRNASLDLVLDGRDIALSYMVTMVSATAVPSPGVFFVVYEDKMTSGNLLACLPKLTAGGLPTIIIDPTATVPTSSADTSGVVGELRIANGAIYFKDDTLGWLTLPGISF
jgi:hypothetical protein